jgi:putative intracellular protease/amidase
MTPGPSDDVHRVSGEIEALRRELGHMVSELDRRRHALLDVRGQVRRHPRLVLAVAGGAALLLGGLLAASLQRRHHRARPSVRARETRRALARLLDHPERVGAEPSPVVKIATAAGVAAGSAVARRVAEQLLAGALRRR